MKIEVASKNYEVPQKLSGLIDKKVSRLSKYTADDARIKVFCRAEKDVFTIELTVFTSKDVIRAEVYSNNMYENLDSALKKIERQLVKRNTKMDNKAKKGLARERQFLFNEEIPEEQPKTLVRTKSYQMRPIAVEDAIEALEMLDHNFYVFQNAKTKQINVLYKRNDGDYGIIEALI